MEGKKKMSSSPRKQCTGGGSKEAKKSSLSVFYTDPVDPPSNQTIEPSSVSLEDCVEYLEGVKNYVELLETISGAGTQLSQRYVDLLQNTPYSEIAGQFHSTLEDVEHLVGVKGAEVKAETEADLRHICKTVNGPEGVKENGDETNAEKDIEVVARSFLRLLQVQYHFFQTTADKLTNFADCHVTDDLKCQTPTPTEELALQLPSPSSVTSGGPPPHKSAKDGKSPGPGNVDSPSRLRKQISSFFSKFGQKSHSAPQSSFYVDLQKKEAGTSKDKDPIQPKPLTPTKVMSAEQTTDMAAREERDSGTHNNENTAGSNFLPNTIPTSNGIITPPGAGDNKKGQGATQEELDIVIDMLSRSHARPMQAIPEHNLPQGLANKAVGSQLASNPPKVFSRAGPNHVNQGAGLKDAKHYSNRMPPGHPAEGGRGDSHPHKDPKTNTWPFKPHQRGFCPGDNISQMMLAYGAYGNTMGNDSEYGAFTMSARPPRLSADATPFMPSSNNMWSMNDNSAVSRDWPQYMSGPFDNTDYGQKHWSTVADSSSCSDESSSNGEVAWNMGLDLASAMNGKRRHSSGEEVMTVTSNSNSTLNKSVESLVVDPKTKTWPPKHPWGNRPEEEPGRGEGCRKPSPPKSPVHCALPSQWSHPLHPSGLSVWDPGLGGNLSQHGYNNLAHGGIFDGNQATNVLANEKKF